MDIFVEQIVKKPPSGKDTALKLLTALAMGLVAVITTLLLFPIGILFLIFIIYITRLILSGYDSEYEYIVTNGELDIDKIIGKRKRRRLLTIKASDFTDYGELKNAPALDGEATLILAAGVSEESECCDYYAEFKHKSFGNARLIFSPDDRVKNALKPYLARAVRSKL
ncbi:MAG: DUF6106 family protein [Oscillospiraceae bacterium]|nr:DUF6106 family protein [Oscillospiraceae bacterium]